MLRPEGAATAYCDYDAFGALLGGAPSTQIRYAGKYPYTVLDWYEFRLRQYIPVLGRFAQPDPAGFIDRANLFTFLANNPLSARDPNGTDRQEVATEATSAQRAAPAATDNAAGTPPTLVSAPDDLSTGPTPNTTAADTAQASLGAGTNYTNERIVRSYRQRSESVHDLATASESITGSAVQRRYLRTSGDLDLLDGGLTPWPESMPARFQSTLWHEIGHDFGAFESGVPGQFFGSKNREPGSLGVCCVKSLRAITSPRRSRLTSPVLHATTGRLTLWNARVNRGMRWPIAIEYRPEFIEELRRYVHRKCQDAAGRTLRTIR